MSTKGVVIDNGKYVFVAKTIGRGAFSKVYKGYNTETNETVAIKIVEKQSKTGFAQRIYEEVKLCKKLHHENIVKLYSFIVDDDNFYFIMEYCAGGDLSMLIKKTRILEETAKIYMIQLAEALKYLKNNNILHRDLKPQNILLTADLSIIKLTDFNFARELIDNDLAQTICGSPLYMAPEVLENNDNQSPGYTSKSDLWSAGLILYEMIIGTSPFGDSQNIVDLINKIKTRNVPYNNCMSSDCNDLVQGLLVRDPVHRLTWESFFKHSWLTGDPSFIATEPNLMWESITQSVIEQPQNNKKSSNPIAIVKHNSSAIVDDYISFGNRYPEMPSGSSHGSGCSPPRRNSFKPGSAPDKSTISDQLWGVMTGSMNMIKGAVDYISSSTVSSGSAANGAAKPLSPNAVG
jgi:serine/threonine protein kinase